MLQKMKQNYILLSQTISTKNICVFWGTNIIFAVYDITSAPIIFVTLLQKATIANVWISPNSRHRLKYDMFKIEIKPIVFLTLLNNKEYLWGSPLKEIRWLSEFVNTI